MLEVQDDSRKMLNGDVVLFDKDRDTSRLHCARIIIFVTNNQKLKILVV